jgi:hypothetical protein
MMLMLQVYVADGVTAVGASWKSSTDDQAAPVSWSNTWLKSGSQTGITVRVLQKDRMISVEYSFKNLIYGLSCIC